MLVDSRYRPYYYRKMNMRPNMRIAVVYWWWNRNSKLSMRRSSGLNHLRKFLKMGSCPKAMGGGMSTN